MMFDNFSGFPGYLKKCSHIFVNDTLIKDIKDFDFILISNEDEKFNYFEENQLIKQNIQNSKVIIIDIIDGFFALCFEKTLIVLKQSLITSVYTLLSNNLNLSVCFLKNTKEKFTEQILNPLIEYDENLKEEIESLNSNLCFNVKVDSFKFWSSVSPCISGYLIKKSYFKINNNRIQSFEDFISKHFSFEKLDEYSYIELRDLGFGTSFIVKLIYHIDSGELFALKKQNGCKPNSELINREKLNYMKIHHPFVPKFYGTTKNNGYIIIEYINGQTLEDCKFDGYNENDIIMIIFELLLIVDDFHNNNKLLIRDLKTNNLIITENKSIVMIDFDRIITDTTQIHTSDLSNEYTAPEVKNKNTNSYKSDIYSLGKVIEFILEKANLKDHLIKQNIVEKCLNENSDQRPSIKEIIDDFFNKFLTISFNHLNKTKIISTISTILSITKHPEAQFNLGVIYFTGEYVDRDIKKAIHYFSLASDQKHSQAQNYLGFIYYTGQYYIIL